MFALWFAATAGRARQIVPRSANYIVALYTWVAYPIHMSPATYVAAPLGRVSSRPF